MTKRKIAHIQLLINTAVSRLRAIFPTSLKSAPLGLRASTFSKPKGIKQWSKYNSDNIFEHCNGFVILLSMFKCCVFWSPFWLYYSLVLSIVHEKQSILISNLFIQLWTLFISEYLEKNFKSCLNHYPYGCWM